MFSEHLHPVVVGAESQVREGLDVFEHELQHADCVEDAFALYDRLVLLYVVVDRLELLALKRADALMEVPDVRAR